MIAVQTDSHGIDGEVAAVEVLADERGGHLRQGGRGAVELGARRGDVHPVAVGQGHDRGQERCVRVRPAAERCGQHLGGFATTTALDELYGLGYANTDAEDAKFEAVTLEQVKAAANKYLKPDALVIAVVKPEKP